MSQVDLERVVANAHSSAPFRQKLRENFDTALAGYDLTAQEKAELSRRNIGAEPPQPGAQPHPGAQPAPAPATGKAKKPPTEPPGTLGGRPVS